MKQLKCKPITEKVIIMDPVTLEEAYEETEYINGSCFSNHIKEGILKLMTMEREVLRDIDLYNTHISGNDPHDPILNNTLYNDVNKMIMDGFSIRQSKIYQELFLHFSEIHQTERKIDIQSWMDFVAYRNEEIDNTSN